MRAGRSPDGYAVNVYFGARRSGSACAHSNTNGFVGDIDLQGYSTGDHLGTTLASGVDINGDGIDDLVAGSGLTGTTAYVVTLASSTSSSTKFGTSTKISYADSSYASGTLPSFGSALAMGKDTTGSNVYFFVGASGWEYSTTTTGQVYSYTSLTGSGTRLIDEFGAFGTSIAGSSY